MPNTKENPPVTLENLLRVKRDEQPDGQFWDSFENDFQRRRLNALVERDSLAARLRMVLMRGLAVGVPAMAAIAFTFYWVKSETPHRSFTADQVVESVPELRTSTPAAVATAEVVTDGTPDVEIAYRNDRLSRQFVVDAIQDDSASQLSFRKVLYTPAIHISAPIGASYVRDTLSSSNYQITTADLKLGRNF